MARQATIQIISGLSGAGKTQALRCFEDLGFFCVDNLIPPLLDAFVRLTQDRYPQMAVVIDTRGGEFFDELKSTLEEMRAGGLPVRLLFMEAADEVLYRRFSETRRRHPMWGEGSLVEAIASERTRLAGLRCMEGVDVLDTSHLSARALKERILAAHVRPDQAQASMQITVVSFGFKHGVPLDADLVLDVRFLPNPHYDPILRPFTGLDAPVRDFVLNHPVTREFLARFLEITEFLIPHYRAEGKSRLTLAIGCTGGRHRSVAMVQRLASILRETHPQVVEAHRDIRRPVAEAVPATEGSPT
ncbi:MAG: RNase adapter RapZ [Candidatus Sericytochromatia bacterium]|nr:RNase adapter RapZ [Candidatus Sericytochromatia bacterium]